MFFKQFNNYNKIIVTTSLDIATNFLKNMFYLLHQYQIIGFFFFMVVIQIVLVKFIPKNILLRKDII